MYKPLTVTAIYPFDKNPTRAEWDDYDYMMQRAGTSNKYVLVQEGPYDYYIYFAEDDPRFPDYLIGKLDAESVQKLLRKCPANRYKVSWRQNYYGDFIFRDGSRKLNVRAAASSRSKSATGSARIAARCCSTRIRPASTAASRGPVRRFPRSSTARARLTHS